MAPVSNCGTFRFLIRCRYAGFVWPSVTLHYRSVALQCTFCAADKRAAISARCHGGRSAPSRNAHQFSAVSSVPRACLVRQCSAGERANGLQAARSEVPTETIPSVDRLRRCCTRWHDIGRLHVGGQDQVRKLASPTTHGRERARSHGSTPEPRMRGTREGRIRNNARRAVRGPQLRAHPLVQRIATCEKAPRPTAGVHATGRGT